MFRIAKPIGLALAVLFTLSAPLFAADSYQAASDAAMQASQRIDQDIGNTVDQLNQELVDQFNAKQAGRSTDAVENRLSASIDQVNEQLAAAQRRDRFTFDRRHLLNTQSIYYPGSNYYEAFNDQIRELDQNFAASEVARRNNMGSDALASQR
ncbi:MAG: hypothetical protein LUC93_07970 [Planctomycetaceae bacterium]|nr:hypothetical protein [Planctomycetaceae bacterium]